MKIHIQIAKIERKKKILMKLFQKVSENLFICKNVGHDIVIQIFLFTNHFKSVKITLNHFKPL